MKEKLLNNLSVIVNNAINEAFDFNEVNTSNEIDLMSDDYIWAYTSLYNNFVDLVDQRTSANIDKFIQILPKLLHNLYKPEQLEKALCTIFEIAERYKIINNKVDWYNYYIDYNLYFNPIVIKRLFRKPSKFIPEDYSVEVIGLLYIFCNYGCISFNLHKEFNDQHIFVVNGINYLKVYYPFSGDLQTFLENYKITEEAHPKLLKLFINYFKKNVKQNYIININEAFDFNEVKNNQTLVNNNLTDYYWFCDQLYNNFRNVYKLQGDELNTFYNELLKIFSTPNNIKDGLQGIIKIYQRYDILRIISTNHGKYSPYMQKYIHPHTITYNIANSSLIELFKKNSSFNPKKYSIPTIIFLYLLKANTANENSYYNNGGTITLAGGSESSNLDDLHYIMIGYPKDYETNYERFPVLQKIIKIFDNFKCDDPDIIKAYDSLFKEKFYDCFPWSKPKRKR